MKRFKCIYNKIYIALERFNCSNPSLEFDNVKHFPKKPNPEDPLLKTSEFPIKNYELNDNWMHKK